MLGAPEGIRTPDPQIRSLVLYPAELPALWMIDNSQRSLCAKKQSFVNAFNNTRWRWGGLRVDRQLNGAGASLRQISTTRIQKPAPSLQKPNTQVRAS